MPEIAGSWDNDSAAEAAALVMRHGWNATAYQIVNPGFRYWVPEAGDGIVGYVYRHGVYVVAGAPVCSEERLEPVLDEWEAFARSKGRSVCYFGAAGRIMDALRRRDGYATVVLGAQPVWDPRRWGEAVDADRSLRAQFRRAMNKGVRVREVPAGSASEDDRLRVCLAGWLGTRGLPPLHFLVEPQTLDRLWDRRVFVAERAGQVCGFLVLAPTPTRSGWLTEQFPRAPGAPNGTVELMFDYGIRAVGRDGSSYVTMGLVPLSTHGFGAGFTNPLWLRAMLGWVRAHGRRFYNFNGLEMFKSKFHPDAWEGIYAISNEEQFSFRSLYAVAAAFSDGPPWLAVTRGFGRAVRSEAIRAFTGRSGREMHVRA